MLVYSPHMKRGFRSPRYVYMCMYIYIYIYIYAALSLSLSLPLSLSIYIYIYIHIHIYICIPSLAAEVGHVRAEAELLQLGVRGAVDLPGGIT